MKSTGEVMGVDKNFPYLPKITNGCGKYSTIRVGIISVRDEDKENILFICQLLEKLKYKIFATKGTANF